MKEKIIQITFCTLFILIIFVLGFLTIINDNEISTKEGRKLTRFPKVTLKSVLKTEYYTKLTNAYADQLAFREQFIKLYYLTKLQKYTGDVVKGENDQLYLAPLIIPNKEKYIKNLTDAVSKDMNNIAHEVTEAGSKFIFVSIPRKDVIMDKYLPDTYIRGTEDYLEYIDIINKTKNDDVMFIDAYELFKQKQDEYYDVFYITDHHMNIRGAYNIFENIISIVNSDGHKIKLNKLEEEYEIKSRVVNGSFNRKIGQSVISEPEELVLVPKDKTLEYTRMDNGDVVDTPVFGDGNTYAVAYMGDDMAETVIDTNNDDAPNILFVGSSYTNILEALSVYKFNKMVSIDYRHNKTGKSIADYVKEHDIDYTVFICSQSTSALAVSSMKEHLGLKD